MVWGDVETVFGWKSGISDFICTFVPPFRLRLVADYDRGDRRSGRDVGAHGGLDA